MNSLVMLVLREFNISFWSSISPTCIGNSMQKILAEIYPIIELKQ